jgi:uroporphyrinogen decarboxylase
LKNCEPLDLTAIEQKLGRIALNAMTNDNDKTFSGLRVVSLESRRATEMQRMIQRLGGQATVCPSMREIPLESNTQAIEFAHQLITGQIDMVIFLTGVGFEQLLSCVELRVDRERYLNSLRDIITVARGPKPTAAMRAVGITPTLRVAEPNTWREVLEMVDRHHPVNRLRVAVQEYGVSNASLIAGLEARGAIVVQVPVYRWDLPEDTSQLEQTANQIAAGQQDVLLVTSAQQATNLMRISDSLGISLKLRNALRQMALFSIGPTTSETLQDLRLQVDGEPKIAKMGQLVQFAAEHATEILKRKSRIEPVLSAVDDDPVAVRQPWYDGPFMKACRREPTDVTPVWLMRQAGRYMAEYRAIRDKVSFLELCKNPALCSEVMCDAVRKLGVDAAIIFSDLLPILEPMGFDLEFAKGEGPVIHNPLREAADVDRVKELDENEIGALDFVFETVRQTRCDLPDELPLIGFSGAPFTLASYAIEGGSSRSYLHTKTIMYRDPGAWDALMQRFVRAIVLYLNRQIAAGAQCVQMFDSWVGCLSPADYTRFALPYIKQIVAGITPGIPFINFAAGNPALLPLIAQAGSDVIGVDWRIGLSDAWKTVGHNRTVQGNLDPLVLLADQKVIRQEARKVLEQANGRPGHIFNLGHGVVQQTPVENAIALVEIVHELSQR